MFPTNGRTRSYVSANYFGNAFAASTTEGIPVDRVLLDDVDDDDGLSIIASIIRRATAHGSDFAATIKDETAIKAQLLPLVKKAIFMPSNFPENQFVVTSWAHTDTVNMDFGIRLPAALRTFNAPMGNAGAAFPGCRSKVYDFLLSLPEHENDLSAKDAFIIAEILVFNVVFDQN